MGDHPPAHSGGLGPAQDLGESRAESPLRGSGSISIRGGSSAGGQWSPRQDAERGPGPGLRLQDAPGFQHPGSHARPCCDRPTLCRLLQAPGFHQVHTPVTIIRATGQHACLLLPPHTPDGHHPRSRVVTLHPTSAFAAAASDVTRLASPLPRARRRHPHLCHLPHPVCPHHPSPCLHCRDHPHASPPSLRRHQHPDLSKRRLPWPPFLHRDHALHPTPPASPPFPRPPPPSPEPLPRGRQLPTM